MNRLDPQFLARAFSDVTPSMKWIIHIGTHKTGTTSIQEYCFDNLAEHSSGQCYYHKYPIRQGGRQHVPLVKSLRSGELSAFRKGLSEIRNSASKKDAATVVLSSEAFSTLESGLVAEFGKAIPAEDDVSVIGYFRSNRAYLNSRIKQILKRRGFERARKFIQSGAADYQPARTIRSWETAVGPDNVHVFHYARVGNVLEHFLDFLGLACESDLGTSKNVSPDLLSALAAGQFLSVHGAEYFSPLIQAHGDALAQLDTRDLLVDDLFLAQFDKVDIDTDHPKLAGINDDANDGPMTVPDAKNLAEYWRGLAEYLNTLADYSEKASKFGGYVPDKLMKRLLR